MAVGTGASGFKVHVLGAIVTVDETKEAIDSNADNNTCI